MSAETAASEVGTWRETKPDTPLPPPPIPPAKKEVYLLKGDYKPRTLTACLTVIMGTSLRTGSGYRETTRVLLKDNMVVAIHRETPSRRNVIDKHDCLGSL